MCVRGLQESGGGYNLSELQFMVDISTMGFVNQQT